MILRMFKSSTTAKPEELDDPSPYFGAVLQHVAAGDQKYVGRIAQLWQDAPRDGIPRFRWWYPVTWDEPDIGSITLQCTISAVNENDGMTINDWIPVGPESWQRLALLQATKPQRRFA
jgi:hypothetical protein